MSTLLLCPAEAEAETATETEAEAGTETEAETETDRFFYCAFHYSMNIFANEITIAKSIFKCFFTSFAWIHARVVPRRGNSKKMKSLQTLRGVLENPFQNLKIQIFVEKLHFLH